jgi:hypothetical protein
MAALALASVKLILLASVKLIQGSVAVVPVDSILVGLVV